jgi:hypothetical protein
MRRRALLLVLGTLLALGGGLAAGAHARRRSDREVPVARVERPEGLAAAWARFLEGRPVGDVPPAAGGGDAFDAERDLLGAVAAGTDAALEDVARRRAGTNAGALAEILLVERTPEGAERTARRERFARRYPRSWWNASPSARSPGR